MPTREIVDRLQNAFNQQDAGAFAALHTAEAIAVDPQYAEPLHGRDAIRMDMEDFFTTFPDATATFSNVLEDGNTVAVEMMISGTNKGPVVTPQGALPATGRRAEMRAGVFLRLDESDLIAESRRYFDLAGLMQQLGVE
jgi:steroid delta-isomerase-like uncharacterized protein